MLLRQFIVEAVRLRAYTDVVWAAAHYEVQHSPDVLVELCATVAYACLGDDDRALRHARIVASETVDVVRLTKELNRIIDRRDIVLQAETPAALVESIRQYFVAGSRSAKAVGR